MVVLSGHSSNMQRRRVYVIAEAGVNHNGDLAMAKQLIDVAIKAGADAVKFQTFIAEHIASRQAAKAEYQKASTEPEETQLAMLKRLELSHSDHRALIAYCGDRIQFLSTAFDLESVRFLMELNLPMFKIPSGEITNLPYLRMIGGADKPVVLSTGMATLSEVEAAVDALEAEGLKRQDLTILHCNTEYPTPFSDVNLRAMCSLGAAFGVLVGYSDHTPGITVAIAAVALGASIIEKHFTLDRNLPGPDHQASLEPDELVALVRAVRDTETALGDGIKRPTKSESKNKEIARKSIVAARPIRMGEAFQEDNITVKRPGTGLSPMEWDNVLGQPAPRDFAPDELICL